MFKFKAMASKSAHPATGQSASPETTQEDWAWRLTFWIVATGLALAVLAITLAQAFPTWLESGARLNPSERLLPPQGSAPLGTDGLGRDLLARLFLAAPNSLGVALAAACLAVIPGACLGAVAAAWRFADAPLMRLADALLTLPPLVLALACLTLFGATPQGLIFALALPEFPRALRFVRVLAVSQISEPWFLASRGLGTRGVALFWILLRPLVPSLTVLFAQVLAIALLVEGLLGFLGLGLPPTHPGWGSMLAEGRTLLFVAPQVVLVPGVCIALFAFLAQLFADSLNRFAERR